MARINLRNCTVKLRDGSGTPKELTIGIGQGNLTWTETFNREYLPDRGILDDVVDGDETPMQVDFQFKFEYLKSAAGATTPTPYEAMHKIGAASTWVSSDADPCHPYSLDLIVENVPNCSTGDNETYVFPDFRVESINPDINGRQVSASGKCNAVRPTITRVAKS
jgi:hypothetical protein